MQTIYQRIAFDSGVHLSQCVNIFKSFLCKVFFSCALLYTTGRDFVSEVMHTHDSDAFAEHEPTAKCIFHIKKYPIGIHEKWAAD